jgi:hypothetical protein
MSGIAAMGRLRRVVYIGPEAVFHGLEGHLIEIEDRRTRCLRLYSQPEAAAIRAIACEPEHVRAVEIVA